MTRPESDCICSVLVVDSSDETPEVLRTVLEPKGVKVFSAAEANAGLALLRKHNPNVTVLDVESADDEVLCRDYDQVAGENLVVLGKLPRTIHSFPRDRVVPKPYHYGPLIRTIEALVEQSLAKAG